MELPYNEVLARVDVTKPYSQGVEIELANMNSSASEKINFDNDLFWCNEIVVTGRDATGKVLETAVARELIIATFSDNFKQKFQGGEGQDVFGLNNTHKKRPNFGWLIKKNAELGINLQCKANNNGIASNTFPYKFHLDFKGFVAEPLV